MKEDQGRDTTAGENKAPDVSPFVLYRDGYITYQELEQVIRHGFSTSSWLQGAIEAMKRRDPVDMLKDIEVLKKLAEARLKRIAGGLPV